MEIKNWKKFQHFKDRRPPWIKLYRDLLDDDEWFELTPSHAKCLVMLWLIASERDGQLPCLKKLAFRLRTPEKVISSMISNLSHWVTSDDITMISTRHHDGPSETETETETETERRGQFETIWKVYPRKVGKQAAWKAWGKLNGSRPDVSLLLSAIERSKHTRGWMKDSGEFIPHLSTWLNGKRWEDTILEVEGGQRPEAPPGKHDPIARGLWKRTYGDPKQYGYE